MLEKVIIKKTFRVPAVLEEHGDGEHVARQLDVALMEVGFKLSRDLFTYLSQPSPSHVREQGSVMLTARKDLLGEHVQHNVYFINFPHDIPDTKEFWLNEIFRLLLTGETSYGRYQHSYEDMLALHDAFLPSLQERVTVLHLGKTLREETVSLYHQLASSATPLAVQDRALVKDLAQACLTDAQPDIIPVRETKAIINAVRLTRGYPFLLDTVTDVLRLACALSESDVTVQESTKFASFSRSIRKKLMHALDSILVSSPAQLADVHQYQEQWKRLGERLHPHEYASLYSHAAALFEVVRGEKPVPTLEAKVEAAFLAQDIPHAIHLLTVKPGMLMRNIDRILRRDTSGNHNLLLEEMQEVLPRVSGRVVLGLREHLQNRLHQQTSRIFTNSKGRAWVREDTLPLLDTTQVTLLTHTLDVEIARRLPHREHLIVDRDMVGVALPLSEKHKASGFSILPRGSVMNVGSELLRFFVYWKQTARRTDYDLSAMLLDKDLQCVEQLSWTNLRAIGATHSGDLVDATDGATECIELDLSRIDASYIVPTINIFSGEAFTEVESCFFGMMQCEREQQGKPFEARAVRFKSDIRGNGRVALPLVFIKEAHHWSAKWMHLHLKGRPNFNRVETTHVSASMLAQSILSRSYLDMSYLLDLLRGKTETVSWYEQGMEYMKSITFIGLDRPEALPREAIVYTLSNLQSLIPV